MRFRAAVVPGSVGCRILPSRKFHNNSYAIFNCKGVFSNATVGPVRDATVSPLDVLVNANVGSKDGDLQPGRDHERSESSCPV